ncbi:MAG: PQQ-binding-like beta-propeller repeat protein, partial [Oscillochloridaceae bacterium umkhey_bin13]
MRLKSPGIRLLLALIIMSGIVLAGLGLAGPRRAIAEPEASQPPTSGATEVTQPPTSGATAHQAFLPTITNGTSSTTSSGWHQLGGNPQRTHYADATLPARSGDLNTDWRMLWIWNGPTGLDSGPAANHLSLPDSVVPIAGGGRLYLGHTDGNVRAISAATGTQLWSTAIGGEILNAGAFDAASSTVYFASTNGLLAKLRASDGALLGSFDAGSAIEQAVLLVGDTVYVGTRGGNFYAVNPTTMEQRWVYNAGAPITASAAYASRSGGLIIFPSEDGQVHAVRTAGTQAWEQTVNVFERPVRPTRPARTFPDVYAVVAEAADVVIIRSYYDWELTWADAAGAPSDQAVTRSFIQNNPTQESFFVLNLEDGSRRFIAPVLGGAMGNGNYYYSSPPQVVIRRLSDGNEVAYLLWRNRQACRLDPAACDGREDTTFGEMDLSTGTIRFVQDYKNEGTIRFPTDEQGPLTMVGNVLFHGHWMSLGAIRIANRTLGGTSAANPIPSEEYLSVTNTLGQGQCAQRLSAERFCPVGHTPPGDGYQLDPGFYIYYHSSNVYDEYWHPPVRGPIYDSGVVYWRSSDGAIVALAPAGVTPPPTASPEPDPSPSASPEP